MSPTAGVWKPGVGRFHSSVACVSSSLQWARSHAVAPSVLQVMNGLMQTTGWPSVVACVGNWFGKGKWVLGCWPSSANAHFLLLRLTSLHVWPHFGSSVRPGFDFCQTTKWRALILEVFFRLAQRKFASETHSRVTTSHRKLNKLNMSLHKKSQCFQWRVERDVLVMLFECTLLDQLHKDTLAKNQVLKFYT